MSERFEVWPVAEEAASYIADGMIVGLGTGRAASMFVHALAARLEEGLSIRGVPTSKATETLAASLGIPLISLEDVDRLDIDVDGADEVDPDMNLIKGHGGALVRERVVAVRSRRFVILVGSEKLVPHLGAAREVPVECVPFAASVVEREIEAMGGAPKLRLSDGEPTLTDNQNYIVDADFGPIEDPAGLSSRLDSIPGTVDNGIFFGMATSVLVQSEDGIRRMQRE